MYLEQKLKPVDLRLHLWKHTAKQAANTAKQAAQMYKVS